MVRGVYGPLNIRYLYERVNICTKMYKMKFKIEIIAIQDSKKTKFKSQYCCKTIKIQQ
jgi:hypothetical protein